MYAFPELVSFFKNTVAFDLVNSKEGLRADTGELLSYPSVLSVHKADKLLNASTVVSAWLLAPRHVPNLVCSGSLPIEGSPLSPTLPLIDTHGAGDAHIGFGRFAMDHMRNHPFHV
jgi:hypothetical protein